MERVSVYYFTKYDIGSDAVVRSKRPATIAAIERVCGQALLDTKLEVDPSALDSEGFMSHQVAGVDTASTA